MKRTILALVSGLLTLTAPGDDAPRPNVLFIFSDDHRHDLLGTRNPLIRTPHLDSLAESGVLFDHAFVTTAICSPSRAAVMSGRYGSRNGVPTLSGPLDFPKAAVPHALRAAGYHTVHLGKWHLGTNPTGTGFEHYARINSNGSWFQRNVDTNIDGCPEKLDGTFFESFFADQVIRRLEAHASDESARPFFIWWCNQVPHVDGRMQYPDVKLADRATTEHEPWGSKGGYRHDYDVGGMKIPANWADDLSTKPEYLAESRFVTKSAEGNYGGPGGYTNPEPGVRNPTLGEDNVQQHLLEYYASITALDAEIGRVLARLEDPNGDGNKDDSIADHTWVVFMGDNGWQTGHHKFTSKVLAYEEACRVPLIVRAPGVSPRVESKLVLNIDLTPMFHDLAGLTPPKHLQGSNLRTLVESPDTDWRSAFYYEAVTPERSLGAKPLDAVRTERHKLIRTYRSGKAARENRGILMEELYDLEADPIEMTNLADSPSHAGLRKELGQALEQEKARIAETPDP